MKKIQGTIYTLALLTLVIASSFVFGKTEKAQAVDYIAIDKNNFPDEAFRNYVYDKIDGSSDGKKDYKLSPDEIKLTNTLIISSSDIKKLNGLQHFTDVRILKISYVQATSIDLSSMTMLKEFAADYCGFTSIKFPETKTLATINLQSNAFTSIDVSKLTGLTSLRINRAGLKSIDVTKNVNLTDLNLEANSLTSIDVSKNVNLEKLEVNDNKLKSLNVKKNAKLSYLSFSNNSISSIDLSANTMLEDIYADNNGLTALDVSKLIRLTRFSCGDNKITSLSINHPFITELYVQNNPIKTLTIDRNAIKTLNVRGCKASILNLTKCYGLTQLTCGTGTSTIKFAEGIIARDELSIKLYLPTNEKLKIVTPDDVTLKSNASETTISTDKTIARATKGSNYIYIYKNGTATKGKFQIIALFNDVIGSYYNKAYNYKYYNMPIDFMSNILEITRGVDGGARYGVGEDCTRKDLAILMWRLCGKLEPKNSASKYFVDVSKYGVNSDTNKAIAWLYEEGIIKGYEINGKYYFKPLDTIVRKDVLIILYRLCYKPDVSGTLSFSDCKSYSKNSDTYKAILWASQNGITKGYDDGTFRPLDNCLREQIATFIFRLTMGG